MRKGILDGLTGKLKIKTGENNFVKQFKALQSHSSHPRQKAMSVFPAPIL